MPSHFLLPVAIAVVGLVALVVPLGRYGTAAVVVDRSRLPVERFVGRVFGLGLTALAVWTGAYAALGPARLGVWSAPPAVTAVGWVLLVGSTAIVVTGQTTMGPSWRIGIEDRPTELVAVGI